MSAIYNLEPQPTASAILHTTQGDIAVELFAKQTPLTCRNFLQLGLDGYYDNTIFHRLVPGFILQGGDPTGTGHGGECIYDGGAFSGEMDPWPMDQRKGKNAGPTGVNFKDEFHSRLKFNRRGLLGMANEGVPNSNGSQFFFTLGKTEELNGKNTVFGRVAGDTIFNLLKMAEAEVGEGSDRPFYPVKITRVEVLINPFEGLQKRQGMANARSTQAPQKEKKAKKRKEGKQLLSFGDEEGDEDIIPVAKKPKYDTRIVVDVQEDPSEKVLSAKLPTRDKELRQKHGFKEKTQEAACPLSQAPEQRTESKPLVRLAEEPRVERKTEPKAEKSLLEKTNDEIAAVKASMKRTVQRIEPVREHKKSALEQLIPETSVRGRKSRPAGGNTVTKEDQEALDCLKAFKSKLEHTAARKEDFSTAAPQEANISHEVGAAASEEICDLHFIVNCQSCQAWDKADAKDESDDEGWMSHALNCVADKLGKDLRYRQKAEEELVVIDPLAKAQGMREEKRAARQHRSAGPGRAWSERRPAR